MDDREFPTNIKNMGVSTPKWGTREPGTKKGNIQGIPVLLEKEGTCPPNRGTLFPGNLHLRAAAAEATTQMLAAAGEIWKEKEEKSPNSLVAIDTTRSTCMVVVVTQIDI